MSYRGSKQNTQIAASVFVWLLLKVSAQRRQIKHLAHSLPAAPDHLHC